MEDQYHWFVTTCFDWAANDSLFTALRQVRDAAPVKGKDRAKLQINVWKVPGPCKGTNYRIENYAPQAEGAEFVGRENWENC